MGFRVKKDLSLNPGCISSSLLPWHSSLFLLIRGVALLATLQGCCSIENQIMLADVRSQEM